LRAAQVTDWFSKIERDPSVCKLDIVLAYEVFVEARAMMLYPINALRNLARSVFGGFKSSLFV
jgi:hypothetical protein